MARRKVWVASKRTTAVKMEPQYLADGTLTITLCEVKLVKGACDHAVLKFGDHVVKTKCQEVDSIRTRERKLHFHYVNIVNFGAEARGADVLSVCILRIAHIHLVRYPTVSRGLNPHVKSICAPRTTSAPQAIRFHGGEHLVMNKDFTFLVKTQLRKHNEFTICLHSKCENGDINVGTLRVCNLADLMVSRENMVREQWYDLQRIDSNPSEKAGAILLNIDFVPNAPSVEGEKIKGKKKLLKKMLKKCAADAGRLLLAPEKIMGLAFLAIGVCGGCDSTGNTAAT